MSTESVSSLLMSLHPIYKSVSDQLENLEDRESKGETSDNLALLEQIQAWKAKVKAGNTVLARATLMRSTPQDHEFIGEVVKARDRLLNRLNILEKRYQERVVNSPKEPYVFSIHSSQSSNPSPQNNPPASRNNPRPGLMGRLGPRSGAFNLPRPSGGSGPRSDKGNAGSGGNNPPPPEPNNTSSWLNLLSENKLLIAKVVTIATLILKLVKGAVQYVLSIYKRDTWDNNKTIWIILSIIGYIIRILIILFASNIIATTREPHYFISGILFFLLLFGICEFTLVLSRKWTILKKLYPFSLVLFFVSIMVTSVYIYKLFTTPT